MTSLNPLIFRSPNNITEFFRVIRPVSNVIPQNVQFADLREKIDHIDSHFHPLPTDFSHPIHESIKQICLCFLKSLPQNAGIKSKLDLCEKAISEIVFNTLDPIDQNNSDLSKYELLEIAVRYHFFLAMTHQIKTEITDRFAISQQYPKNLGKWENLLIQLVTKNGFYNNAIGNIVAGMHDIEQISKLIETCALKGVKPSKELSLEDAIHSNEKLIKNTLNELRLNNSSQYANYFELHLREYLQSVLICSTAQLFEEQFDKIGLIEINDIIKDIHKASKNIAKFYDTGITELSLIAQIFNLNLQDDYTFSFKYNQIECERIAELNKLEKDKSYLNAVKMFFCKDTMKIAINARADKREKILQAIELRWKSLFAMQQVPPPSAPVFDLGEVERATEEEKVEPAFIIQPIKHKTDSKKSLPLVSYVDLVFAEQLENSDFETWQQLPDLVKRDVLRHAITFYKCKGKAEDLAKTLFPMTLQSELNILNAKKLEIAPPNLDVEFVEKGENLLDQYYSKQGIENPFGFWKKFQTLEPNVAFLQSVYEIAKHAGVQIESWDNDFATNNWHQQKMVHLSVQALEKCLHT